MEILKQFTAMMVFLLGYHFGGIFVATILAMIAGTGVLIYDYLTQKKLDKMQLISLGLILVLGGLTLFFQDERFIKLKPTLLNSCFAAAFLGSVCLKRPLLELMLKQHMHLPTLFYRNLSIAWGLFFIVLAILNLWVVATFETQTWVYYKVFGQMGLTIIFVIIQSIFLSRTTHHE